MSALVHILIFVVLVAFSTAQNLTVPSSREEYAALWDRKFQNDIALADLRVQCVDNRGADAIRLIKDQQEETLREIKRFEDSLVPMEAISMIHKHCVQKYKGMLAKYDSVSSSFASCSATAQNRVNSLTATAKAQVAQAKLYAFTNIPTQIVNCNKTHYKNETANEECVISQISYYAGYIDSNLRTVDKNLDASVCTSTDLSRDAVQCSFKKENSVIYTIGKVDSLISTCVQETGTMCPCAKTLMIDNTTPNIIKLLTTTTTAAPSG